MYQMWVALFLLLLALATVLSASEVKLPIEGRLRIPHGGPVGNIKIVLNRDEYITMSRADGNFTFPDVESGIYLMEVLSINEVYSQVKLKVDKVSKTVNVIEYKYPGAARTTSTYPIELTALTPMRYFHKPPEFSIWGLIRGNPMIIMMVLSAGLMFALPQMLKNLDPDAMKELEEMQQNQENPMDALKSMFNMS